MRISKICGFVMTIAVIMIGCSGKNDTLLNGSYVLESGDASIVFDTSKEDITFVFTYDLLSSYANMGTVEIKNGTAVCKTEDGEYEFVFDIRDDKNIVYNGKSSKGAMVEMHDGSLYGGVSGDEVVKDGDVFVYEQNFTINR